MKQKIKYRSDKELANQNEVDRLKRLLKARAEEYKIFGATAEDRQKDFEIRQKIYVLALKVK